ncbi:hypothetical protein THAOC_17680 [Thalassiosira oceanica]|uniref:RxLR effector protein n=1 Tax=Thalassiosira oceanica TaxID=159749 RepID=K0SU67_THAOC|nr:hypothetical protein THAOC_17680 [Thalassiosira oceanica]|eukprot:EJK61772.1 hypothetical protein THAOC_17680 [Thalassiosira oceanica]
MVAISVLAIVALGTLVSSEVHQDDGNFVGHSDRRLVRSLKSTKRGKGKKRQSKAKSGKSKGAKSYPTANPTSRPTSDPSPPEQSQLKQDIAAATSKRATDRQSYGWVDENERN